MRSSRRVQACPASPSAVVYVLSKPRPLPFPPPVADPGHQGEPGGGGGPPPRGGAAAVCRGGGGRRGGRGEPGHDGQRPRRPPTTPPPPPGPQDPTHRHTGGLRSTAVLPDGAWCCSTVWSWRHCLITCADVVVGHLAHSLASGADTVAYAQPSPPTHGTD